MVRRSLLFNGNYASAWMVLQTGLHFVSKLRSAKRAALYEPFMGKYCRRGPHPKYGGKIDVRKMKKKYLKSDTGELQLHSVAPFSRDQS